MTTTGNNWGSDRVYNANRFYDQATGDITFLGDNSFGETVKVFAQDSSNGVSGDGNNEVGGTSTNSARSPGLGPIRSSFGIGTATPSTFFFNNQADLDAFFATLTAPQKLAAVIETSRREPR